MTNELTTFTFAPANAQVRVVTINGNPWFVASDVCRCLGLDLTNGGAVRHLRFLAKDECQSISKRTAKTLTQNEGVLAVFRGNEANLTLISESGLYKLVMRSDKPEARKFQDWMTREVLPAIRKDGAYIMGEEKVRTGEMDEDELVLRAYDLLRAKVERLKAEKEKLEAENTSMGEVIGAHMHTVARFCRTIPGINTNATKRDLMREGYLYWQGGTYRVYRKHADLFEEKFNEEYGTVDIYLTEKGKRLLLDLNRQGKLTKLKRAA